jgi:hypothetical protein
VWASKGSGHERVANQLVRDFRNQAVEPSFGSETIPDEVGFRNCGGWVADHGRQLERHLHDLCSIVGLHWANSYTIQLASYSTSAVPTVRLWATGSCETCGGARHPREALWLSGQRSTFPVTCFRSMSSAAFWQPSASNGARAMFRRRWTTPGGHTDDEAHDD